MPVNVLFYAPQYRPNLSSMIRTAEFYGLDTVYIVDDNNIILPLTHSKKARADMAHMARVWTAGAIEFVTINKIEDPNTFLQNYKGRKIATLVDDSAQFLSDFEFQEDDLIIFGSERDGLPENILPLIDQSIYLPTKGNTSCLNVAVTFGIVLNQAIGQ